MKASLSRVLALLKKDLFWAVANLKLLLVMTTPLLLTIFFSVLDKESTFGFTIVFLTAFVGIFSTSYFVIEEKQKGTLLSLLTSPLRSYELLLGKFLFNLILCLLFSLFAVVLNQRFDLLANPLVLINLILFAGTNCFFGFVLGVFFKKEQEMSIAAPLLMFFFCSGDIFYKASQTGGAFPYFPDFHLLQMLKEVPVSSGRMLVHSFFNLLYFAIALLTASFYTRFYFSNSRERRWSPILIYSAVAFAAALMLSGGSVEINEAPALKNGYKYQKFVTEHWVGRFEYEPQAINFKNLIESSEKIIYVLQDKENEDTKLIVSIRDATSDELTPQARRRSIINDSQRFFLAGESLQLKTREFQRYTYFKDKELVILVESLCEAQILQISFHYKMGDVEILKEKLELFERLLRNLSFTCRK